MDNDGSAKNPSKLPEPKRIPKRAIRSTSACESQAITMPVEDEDFLFAMETNALIALPLVLKATIELEILEIMTECGPTARLSPAQVASYLSAKNPQAPETLDRILRLLVSYSILSCTLAQDTEDNPLRLYGFGTQKQTLRQSPRHCDFCCPVAAYAYRRDRHCGLVFAFFFLSAVLNCPCPPSHAL